MPNRIADWTICQIRKLLTPKIAINFAGLNFHPLFFYLSASIILCMSQPFKLFRLQQIDSQIDKTKTRLREIEIELQEDSELRMANQRLDQASQLMQETEKALRKAEADVQAQRIKIEQTEAALYGGKVRNPKELQDLQHESAALKRYKSTLEDRQLEIMLTLEETEAELQSAVSNQQTAELNYTNKNARLLEEQAALLRDIERDENERRAAIEGIPQMDLQLYQQLRQQRRGIAVAKVVDRTCSACGSLLNTGLLSAAHSSTQLTRCDTCGRILYVA
jgi:uncharacterized protein